MPVMELDTPTIVVISVVIDFVLVLILLHTRRTRTTYSGFKTWIAGTACWSFGSLLAILFSTMHPQFIPKIIGNSLIMLHPVLLYEGIERFHGIRRRWSGTLLNCALLLAGILNQLYFFYISENIAVRTAGISIVLAIIFARISLEPLFYARIRRYSMQWLLSTCLLPLVALLAARAWANFPSSPVETLSAMIAHDKLLQWVIFYGIFVELVIAYSYLSLTSDRVEREQRERNELYAMFMLHSPIYTYIKEVTPTRSVVLQSSYSYQQLTGIAGPDLIGKNMEEIFPPETAAKITKDDWEVVSTEKVLRLEEDINGRSFTTIKFPFAWGDKTFLAGYTIDITERKNLEKELKESEQRLTVALADENRSRMEQERFLDMISHEYRTPLAIIQANIDILELKDELAGHSASGSLIKMQQAVERLVDIFEATRAPGGGKLRTFTPTLEIIKVEQCFRESLNAAVDIWGEHLVCLTKSFPDGWLHADVSLMQTALFNLVDNAVKYSPPGLPVTAQIGISGDRLELTVRNHPAVALPGDTKPLFNKFCRGLNSAGTSGTGLGLYLIRHIMEQHGGGTELTVDESGDVVALIWLPLNFTPGIDHAQ
jgi:PAS domain S-box-containing protein